MSVVILLLRLGRVGYRHLIPTSKGVVKSTEVDDATEKTEPVSADSASNNTDMPRTCCWGAGGGTMSTE